MKMSINIFEFLKQKIMYIGDLNYYFSIDSKYQLALGEYELDSEEILKIAKENDPEEFEVFSRTSIEQRLEKINHFDLEEIIKESATGEFTLCLHPSRQCNLDCKYCFKDSEYLGSGELSFRVAKDAIDYLVDTYAPCASKYVVDLSGSGEPLLQIGLVRQIVDYCKQKRNEVCKNIEVMFCTNLTLLTPEIAAYLDNEPSIILGTSMDGDQITHDGNRVYANGEGTYKDIVNALKMFKNKKIGIAVTVTPLNQDVDLIYDHLYCLPNVDCVSMNFIRCFNGTEYDLENFNVPYLISRYEKLAQNILDNLNRGNSDYFIKILKGADHFGNYIFSRIFKGTYKIHRCNAGKSRVTVNYEGDIFACSVMYGNSDFRIGNIYRGVEPASQKNFEVVSTKTNNQCSSCNIRYACGGECYVNAYLKNKSLYTPLENLCKINLELNKLSMAFVEYIRQTNTPAYKKLIDLAFEISKYKTTSPTIWAIMSYLKERKISYDYNILMESIRKEDCDASPQAFLKLLKRYDANIDAYQIEAANLNDLTFPAVALMNKRKTGDYHYLLLVGLEEDKLLYKTMSTDNRFSEKIKFERFLEEVSDLFFL